MEIKEKIIDKVFEVSMLFDFYGELLTGRQKSVMEYYYNDNFSFAEIAETLRISRQAVYDALHKAENSLGNYEVKLGLVRKFRNTMAEINAAKSEIDSIIAANDDEQLMRQLISVKKILDRLEE
ncbi:MAG: YlxM family DNA-binding protein [Anaerovoracaceae bacterium]